MGPTETRAISVALGVALWLGLRLLSRQPGAARGGPGQNRLLFVSVSGAALLIGASFLLARIGGDESGPWSALRGLRRPCEFLVNGLVICVFIETSFALATLWECWRRARALYGGSLWAVVSRMYRLRTQAHPDDRLTEPGNVMFFVTLVVLDIAAQPILAAAGYVALLAIQVVALLDTAVKRTLPPGVLFLSASTATALDDHNAVASAIGWYPVVSLVDPNVATVEDTGEAGFVNFRTAPGVDWQPIVLTLAALAPIIVLDLRSMTDLVRVEIAQLRTHGWLAKTLVVQAEGTPLPPELEGPETPPSFHTQAALVDAVRAAMAKARVLQPGSV